MNFFDQLFYKKVSPVGLAVFRICYSFFLLTEIFQLLYFKALIFDTIPYLQPSPLSIRLILAVWFFFVVLIMIGFFTRIATVVNYVFILFFANSLVTLGYGDASDYIMRMMGFL